jgi:hypothetical protein
MVGMDHTDGDWPTQTATDVDSSQDSTN